jgi:S-methylmethionine-dependent homocysteine/selenocysteine methylase
LISPATGELSRRLSAGEVVVVDGGMGSELQARGATTNDAAWTGVLALENGQLVQEVHEDFIRAGADVIITDTFFATRPRLERVGLGDRVEEVNRRAVEAAIAARNRFPNRCVAIAGSISYSAVLDPQARHESLMPRAPVSPAVALADYRQQAHALTDAGVDLLALEMMTAPEHAVPALEAAFETGLPIWLGVSAARDASGTLVTWRDAFAPGPIPLRDLLEPLLRPELAAVCVMHTELEDTKEALAQVRSLWRGVCGCYPHAGKGRPGGWVFTHLEAEAFAEEAVHWVQLGAQLIGGCCGVRPDHIAAVSKRLSIETGGRDGTGQ